MQRLYHPSGFFGGGISADDAFARDHQIPGGLLRPSAYRAVHNASTVHLSGKLGRPAAHATASALMASSHLPKYGRGDCAAIQAPGQVAGLPQNPACVGSVSRRGGQRRRLGTQCGGVCRRQGSEDMPADDCEPARGGRPAGVLQWPLQVMLTPPSSSGKKWKGFERTPKTVALQVTWAQGPAPGFPRWHCPCLFCAIARRRLCSSRGVPAGHPVARFVPANGRGGVRFRRPGVQRNRKDSEDKQRCDQW